MKKIILFIFALAFSIYVQAEKHALIIAVGDYPVKTGWSSISSANDVPLIKNTLLNQAFKEENIVVLKNEMATRAGILEAIKALQAKIKPGDIVVIHYSGHGQQIFDDNGEEIDDKDESIVPYDALVRFIPNKYEGQNHIRDDELGSIIATFRNTLGSNGQLLMLLDSCHSGSATRGGKARGGEATFAPPGWKANSSNNNKGSGLLEPVKAGPNAAPFVMLSGAAADELNYEYEGYGSLSFAFSKAMNDLGSDVTYRKLFSAISANMNVISPNQTPTAEGDLDYKLFGGEYVKQQPYFEISRIARPDIIRINGGKLQGLFDGTTVNILPSGTSRVSVDEIVAKGTITRAGYNGSVIKLDKPLDTTNERSLWVFVDQPAYGDLALKIYFDKSVKDKSVRNGVKGFLTENNLGSLVNKMEESDVILSNNGGVYTLNATKGIETFHESDASGGEDVLEDIKKKLYNYAQGNYLKNLSLKNYDYEFEFKLLPIEYDMEMDLPGELMPEDTFLDDRGKFMVNTSTDHVVLQVTNKSDRPLYFSIIEINTQGEIAPFMPNYNCTLNDNERKIGPGETMTFKDCIYSFGPPYETLILKAFATPTPINFKPTVETRGEPVGTRFVANPLERFVQNTYSQSRGSGSKKSGERIEGFSTEFVYEIKD